MSLVSELEPSTCMFLEHLGYVDISYWDVFYFECCLCRDYSTYCQTKGFWLYFCVIWFICVNKLVFCWKIFNLVSSNGFFGLVYIGLNHMHQDFFVSSQTTKNYSLANHYTIVVK